MNLIKTLKKEWYILAILLLPYLVAPFIWDQLPNQMPIHFNLQGEAVSYGDTSKFVFLFPLIGISIYFGILLTPYIDPKKRLENDQKPLPALRLFLPIFINSLFILVVLAAIRPGFDQNFAIYLTVTILLLILGNYISTIKHNYFIGIRTPWSLEDPNNWKQTHRFTSKLWTGSSFLLLLISFFTSTQFFSYIFFAGIIIMAILPIGYSYLLFYQKEHEKK